MIYKELARYADYDIPIIEIYNESGVLEYAIDLSVMQLEDIDIEHYEDGQPFGIIKLYRDYEKGNDNDKNL